MIFERRRLIIDKKVKELYNKGNNVSEIAKDLSLSLQRVSKYLQVNNTPCDCCGEINNNRVFKGTRVFCSRHYQQMNNYGKCFKSVFDGNEFIEKEDYYEIHFNNTEKFALISKESFEKVKQYKWHIRPDGYIEAKNSNKENILLHRLVTDFKYETVDHINRKKLDNRLENLREVTVSQNQINKSMQKNNTSGVVGVSWDKDRGMWHVMITVNKKHINLGRYTDLEVAKSVRLEAEKRYHKEYTPIERKSYGEDKKNQRVS